MPDLAQLRTRYGGSYVLSISTNLEDMKAVENVVRKLSDEVMKVYNVAGTQKFQFPVHQVRVSDIFHCIEELRKVITIVAYGVTVASLEDVFVNVVNGIYSKN